jgi:hypothetical protein
VLSVEQAMRLRAAGLHWTPARGDRFVILQPDLLDQPFVLSDMTVDVHEFPSGPVVGFNGTTEWALDSVDVDQTVWLPHEHQLREQLGGAFARLDRDSEGYAVSLVDGVSFRARDADDAYAAAVLHQLTDGRDPRTSHDAPS